jgi:alpha-D-xyloside xylohydrolase
MTAKDANNDQFSLFKWNADADESQDAQGRIFVNTARFPKITQIKDPTFLLVRKVTSYQKNCNSVIFQTEGGFCRQVPLYRYFDFRPTYHELNNTRNICVKVSFVNEWVVRVQMAEGNTVPDHLTEMITDCRYDEVKLDITEEAGNILIKTATLTVTVQKDPWNLMITGRNGEVFYRQFGDDEHSFMKHEICSFGFLYDRENNEKFACEAVCFDYDEHFYGFGEKFGGLDKKGQAVNLWNTNAMGINTERSYKNVPFFMSSKGYGVFYNTSYKLQCDMGNTLYKAYSIMSGDQTMDFFIIYGPSLKEILPRYTAITGQPNLPPKWSFGLWMSKISYSSRSEVETVARKLRDHRIPCDVIHIDTDWFDENWVCNWKFSEQHFPNVAEMIANLARDGFKISLWQLPYVEEGQKTVNEAYNEGLEKGYFASGADGELVYPHGLIDFSNPAAVDWYKNKLLKPLLEMGIKAIKVDFGESAPSFYKYQNCEGAAMHNLYALLYNKAVYEVTRETLGAENAVIWGRSAWAGAQKYPVHWGGDAGTDFHSLTCSIRGGLSFGLSGFPFWSHDMGGFWFNTNPVLYARWTQVGLLSSHARAHGFYTREPWDFGAEFLAIFKKYAELRYRLMPYIYSSAVKCVRESLPMFRALVVEYQDDPAVATIDDQYLFGESLLVAPILNETNQRAVYLPEGVWTDFWDQQQYQGKQWLKYQASLDKLPIFIKHDAIIPMGPVMNYVDEKECDPITLHLYPVEGDAGFEIIDDEHDIIKVATAARKETFSVMISPGVHHFILDIHNIGKIDEVKINGKKIIIASDDTKECYQSKQELMIKISGQADRESEITILKA